jgi:predicted transcriptional regulator
MSQENSNENSAKRPVVLVEDIMASAVYRVTGEMKISDVITMLTTHKISGAPVTDNLDQVISVMSEGDALRLAASEGLDTTVGACLAKLVKPHKVITLKRDATFADAYKIFLKQGIHRIIVVDSNGRLQGVISRSNILRLLVENK